MSEFTNKINYIFNGDCRDLLKQYRDECFDCVVSDVPAPPDITDRFVSTYPTI